MRDDRTNEFRPHALVLIFLMTLIGACGTGSSGESSSSATPPALTSTNGLPGTTTTHASPTGQSLLGEWELLGAESEDLALENEEDLIVVTFTADRVFGIESCAPFEGTYQMDGDVLVLVEVETTAEGCSDWTDDANVFRFAKGNPTVSIEGDRMVLIRSDWRLEFGRIP